MTTTDVAEFDELIERLTNLGDALDLAAPDLVDRTMARIAKPDVAQWRGRSWLVAAAILALAVGVALHPDSRAAVARWFGVDGVIIEIDPTLTLPPPPQTFDVPGPGESRVVVVDGREVLVSAIDGRLEENLISKTVSSSDQIQPIEVMGHPGLWIGGAPHEVLYQSDGGEVTVQRVAGNTLLWSDDAVLYRVEGFEDLADAMSFVEGNQIGSGGVGRS